MGETIFEFMGGLGLFVLGIFLFDEAIRKLVTQGFKNLIKKTTSTVLKYVGTGILATTILQGSAAVSLIIVSFVAAGIIDFSGAVGVILGSNIGTSIVSIVLGNLGLRFSLANIAFPILCIAAWLLFIFSKSKKVKNIMKIVVGLSLLFLGLSYMNDSVLVMSSTMDIIKISSGSIFLYFLVGLVLTVLTHSSSITLVLGLTAINAGLIDYRIGIMLTLGAFLGTTSTVLIGAIGGNYLKKQVACSHFFFNLFSCIFGYLTLPLSVYLLNKLPVDEVLGMSLFAVFFKVFTVGITLPFLKYFIKFLQKIIPTKHTHFGLWVENVQANVVDACLPAIHHDTISLLKKTFKYILNLRSVDEKEVLKKDFDLNNVLGHESLYDRYTMENQYRTLKEIEQILMVFQSEVKKNMLVDDDERSLSSYYISLMNIVYAGKYMKDIAGNIYDIQYSTDDWVVAEYHKFRGGLTQLYKDISKIIDGEDDEELLENIITIMESIKIADENFIDSFTGNIKSNMDPTIVSDLLHVNRYFYLSCFYLVSSLKNLFLSDYQRSLLSKIQE